MFMSRDSLLEDAGVTEDPGIDIRGFGDDMPSKKGQRDAKPSSKPFAIRPVSARSYNNAMNDDGSERPTTSRGSRPFSPMDRKESLVGTSTVTTYSNDLFGDEVEEGLSAGGPRSPNSKFEVERRQRLQQQKELAAQRRKERSLSLGMVVSNDSMMPRPSSARTQSSSMMRTSRSMSIGNLPTRRAPEAQPFDSRQANGEANKDELDRKGRIGDSPMLSGRLQKASSLNSGLLQDSLRAHFTYHPSIKQHNPNGSHDKTLEGSRGSKPLSPSAKEVERELEEQGISSVFDPSQAPAVTPQLTRSASLDIADIRVFLMQPGPPDTPLHCHIRRDKGARGTRIYPRYSLHLTDGDRFLLSARKRKKSKSSNYIISLDEDDTSRNSGNYFGKLRSNFLGTEFWLYDKGVRKQGVLGEPVTLSPSQASERQELGAVLYQYNVLGTRGPRKMTAMIPTLEEGDKREARPIVFRPTAKGGQAILDEYKANPNTSKLLTMRNKPPKWNDQLGAYCLNFNGRVTHASVKNFQLVSDADRERVILQFGKVGKDFFTMDYVHPMSALQAFAICLTSFDNKLACE